MPTIIGLIFVLFGLYCLFQKEDWLFGLVIFSALFQASSALNLGSQGIQPYYVMAGLFVFSQAKKAEFWKGKTCFSGERLLLPLGCLGVISALLYPILFAGVPVYSPKLGVDDGFFLQLPLHLTLGNLAQAAYLIINLLTIKAAAAVAKTDATRVLYKFTFAFLIVLIFVQFACLQFGISFPYSLIDNNPGYALTEISNVDVSARVFGTFTEPSGAGLALVLFFAGCFYKFFTGAGSVIPVILAVISIGIVRSSSSLLATVAIAFLILISYPIFRTSLVIRKQRLAKLLSVLAIMLVIALSGAGKMLAAYTIEKDQSLSYIHRTAADVFSLQLAANTHWIGVGLGSNRPSSLITSLLSNIGIPGTILFLLTVIRVAQNARGEHAWIRWSLFGAILAASLGDPDITQPMIWVLMAMAAHYGLLTENDIGLNSPRAAIRKSVQVS